MSFTEAVRTALSKYVVFSGRARRSEYWWFILFVVLVSVVAGVIDTALGTTTQAGTGLLGGLAALALLLPQLAVGVRRLHDTGRSGWWLLIAFVPLIGTIVLIVFFVQDSQPQPNQHGPSPKAAPVGY